MDMQKRAESLTEEQKMLLPKLKRNRLLILVGILAALVAVVLYATLSCRQAEEAYEALCVRSDKNLTQGVVDPELVAQRSYAMQVMEQAQGRMFILIGVGIFCAIAGTVLCIVYYKLSYPWLSAIKRKKNRL